MKLGPLGCLKPLVHARLLLSGPGTKDAVALCIPIHCCMRTPYAGHGTLQTRLLSSWMGRDGACRRIKPWRDVTKATRVNLSSRVNEKPRDAVTMYNRPRKAGEARYSRSPWPLELCKAGNGGVETPDRNPKRFAAPKHARTAVLGTWLRSSAFTQSSAAKSSRAQLSATFGAESRLKDVVEQPGNEERRPEAADPGCLHCRSAPLGHQNLLDHDKHGWRLFCCGARQATCSDSQHEPAFASDHIETFTVIESETASGRAKGDG